MRPLWPAVDQLLEGNAQYWSAGVSDLVCWRNKVYPDIAELCRIIEIYDYKESRFSYGSFFRNW